eukprot:CAMPEP_0171512430 /NCGR_PEP_ID=MMETSP0959-20130129/1584_1 /TAXON_ID=87120 /ORGANISM="Aurantiochytrium limacinum, Strain ATCCMYA-1381" /LENGTH=464 /DNA_ID=CAMNT_0012050243 /DNA_START=29 /DNA_END=1423 /DNA_ORIENTATION=+
MTESADRQWGEVATLALAHVIGGIRVQSALALAQIDPLDDHTFRRISDELYGDVSLCSSEDFFLSKYGSRIHNGRASMFAGMLSARCSGLKERFCLTDAFVSISGVTYLRQQQHPITYYINLCAIFFWRWKEFEESDYFDANTIYSIQSLCDVLDAEPRLIEAYSVEGNNINIDYSLRPFVMGVWSIRHYRDTNFRFSVVYYATFSRIDQPIHEFINELYGLLLLNEISNEAVHTTVKSLYLSTMASYQDNLNLVDLIRSPHVQSLTTSENESFLSQCLIGLALSQEIAARFHRNYLFFNQYVMRDLSGYAYTEPSSISIELILRSQLWWDSVLERTRSNEAHDCVKCNGTFVTDYPTNKVVASFCDGHDVEDFSFFAHKHLLPYVQRACAEKRFIAVQVVRFLNNRLHDDLVSKILVDFVEFDFGPTYMRLPFGRAISSEPQYTERRLHASNFLSETLSNLKN